MNLTETRSETRRAVSAALAALMILMVVAMPASAGVNALRNAFNPRGFFLSLKSTDQTEWLRSSFVTGFYRAGEGGQGGGGGNGGNSEKDDLGHSNVQYNEEEVGLDFVDAEDVDTIYSTFDHNPTPGKNYMIGYSKDEQAASLEPIPNFTSYIGTPARGSATVVDPSGGQWWNIPIKLQLGEENEDGSVNAMAPGTLYEFAFLRGIRANNGTSCVLMPGDTEGTYKGYISFSGSLSAAEQAEYDAHQYDEYEFITNILPEGTAGDFTVDHTVESVPMRYHIQTFASLKSWNESEEYKEAETILANVSEADYASGKYQRENITALRETLQQLNEEAETSVKYQLQKDAEWTIQQMLEDLKKALDAAKSSEASVNFEDYNTALSNAETVYNDIKDKTGTAIDQYLPGPVEALRQAIDHAKSTINGSSTQEAVNNETAALNVATMNALDALVRPNERIFQDDATGIVVTAPADALPETARLAVREVVSSSYEYDSFVSRISPKPDAAVVYRIVFYDGTNVVHPTQPVTVQIPLQDALEKTTPSVYYLDDTGAAGRDMHATAPEGYRVFSATQLGTFAVAGQKQQDTPKDPGQTTPNQQNQTPTNRNNNQTPSQNTNPTRSVDPTRAPAHSTTRTTTRRTTRRTTRIIRTTRDPNNDQNKRNEVTSTSVLQTRAVQPTTMITSTTAPTTASDTSDLEQDTDQNTLLFIALGIAAAGLGTLGYQLVKDGKLKKDDDEDAQL